MPISSDSYGVINPYLAVELKIGSRVNWRSVMDHRVLIEQVLESNLYDFLLTSNRGGTSYKTPLNQLPVILRPYVHSSHKEKDSRWGVTLPFFDTSTIHRTSIEYEDLGQMLADMDIEGIDLIQGLLQDCYLMAVISSLEWTYPGYCIKKRVNQGKPESDQRRFIVTIWKNLTPACWKEVEVDACQYVLYSSWTSQRIETIDVPGQPDIMRKKPITMMETGFLFAQSREKGECWPSILEKAVLSFIQASNQVPPDNDFRDCTTTLRGEVNWDNVAIGRPGYALELLCGLDRFEIEQLPDTSNVPNEPMLPYPITEKELWDFIVDHSFQVDRKLSRLVMDIDIREWEDWLSQEWFEEVQFLEGQLSDQNKSTIQFNTKYPMVAGTIPYERIKKNPNDSDSEVEIKEAIKNKYNDINICPGHVYSILSSMQISEPVVSGIPRPDLIKRYVILRNPWGCTDANTKITNLGLVTGLKISEETAKVVLNQLPDDGLFALPLDEFLEYFYQIWTLKKGIPFVPRKNMNRTELLIFRPVN
jgi:hypothetical protein